MPTDKLVSVADESIDVMLCSVFTRRHFEYVCNAQHCLVCVTIYNNLPNNHNQFILSAKHKFDLDTWLHICE